MIRSIFYRLVIISVVGFIFTTGNVVAFDVELFIDNFKNRKDQKVLVGHIDSLAIIRGNAEFYLTDGELTMFDFGCGRPCAMVFDGKVRFIYSPPDEIEHYQLRKLSGKDTLNYKFDKITFFYTIELDNFPDTAPFTRQPIPKEAWKIFERANKDAFNYSGIYIPNHIIGDLLTGSAGTFFYADIWTDKFNHLAFREDPRCYDVYQLIKMRRAGGIQTYDVYGGYSADSMLPGQRGLMPIDIKHYEIESKIERGGKMTSKCRIHFTPMRWGRQFFYLFWYDKNKVLFALDSSGDSLFIVNKKNEYGIGVVLNKPMIIGEDDYIDINFKCESLRNYWGVFYIDGQTYWYPSNIFWDRATFELTYDCIEDYEVVSCGELIESSNKNGRRFSRWKLERPVNYVSFNLGKFESKDFVVEGIPPVKVYMAENIRHEDMAAYMAKYHGELTSANMIEKIGSDAANSLVFFTWLLGPCPFDTIKVTEIPFRHGQGSPGMIHLSWGTFQFDDLIGGHEQFRAHEVSHQWLGHVIDNASYRDTWIIEGLADYCGFLYYGSIFDDTKNIKTNLYNWRREIILGGESKKYSTDLQRAGIDNYITVTSEGSKAGPMVLGRRLNSSKSFDYQSIVYTKAAYIFHMIRYLMHDYKTDSDEAFVAFLHDLLDKYKDRPITTAGLQKLIEEHVQTDMNWFFDQWVYGIHIPTYRFSYDCEQTPDGQFQVTYHVSQKDVPDGFKMVVPLTVVFEDGKFAHLRYWIDQPEQDIQLPLLPLKPKDIKFNTHNAVLCKVK